MECGDASPLLDGTTRRALTQGRRGAVVHIIVANTQKQKYRKYGLVQFACVWC